MLVTAVAVSRVTTGDGSPASSALTVSSAGVSERMRRQLRQGTAPELALRQALHARGHRYRVAWPVPGGRRRTIDIAFTRRRVAVFVDGCFWHCCPSHATWPESNADWWATKLRRNVERDRETDELLIEAGWSVVRVWEHEEVAEAVRLVESVLAARPGEALQDQVVDAETTGVSASEHSSAPHSVQP